MIFDLGCCCSQPITGLYDFYGTPSWGNTSTPLIADCTSYEIDSVLTRHPSHRVIISNDVIGTTNRISDIFLFNRVSCVINDWYINLVSGSGMNDNSSTPSFVSAFDEDERQYTISPNYSTDLVWLRHKDVTDINSSYNALYNGGTGLGSGWTVGSGARIENNLIVLTTGDITSGAYIEKSLPDNDVPWYLRFQLNSDYDKYILLTTENTGSTFEPYEGYNIWINTTSPQLDSVFTVNTGASSLFLPNVVASKVGDYIEYHIGFEHFYGTKYIDFDPITKLRIAMVDDLSGFTINDTSGYNADIREIYFSYGKNDAQYYNDGFLFNLCQISLINTQNKSIITRFNPRTGVYLGDHVTGTNLASLLKMTGQRMSETKFFGAGSSDGFFDEYIMDNNYHTTQNMLDIGGSLDYNYDFSEIDTSGFFGYIGFAYPSNIVLPYQQANCSCYNTSISNEATGISFRSFTHDGRQFFHAIDYNIDMTSWNSLSSYCKFNTIYDSMYLINNTGGTGFIFGENFRPENAEYDIPTGVKFIVFTGGDLLLEPYVDDFNAGTGLPRIQLFTPRDFPNCFSILQPKARAVFGTGQIPQSLEQTIEILYGPYKKSNITVSYISGNGASLTDMNITGLNRTNITYGPSLTASFFDINHHYIHGDTENSEVFWSDSMTQNRYAYPLYTNGGTGIRMLGIGERESFSENGRYLPNVTAKVLWGDSYNGTPAAIFAHSRNYTGVIGNPSLLLGNIDGNNLSGEAYLKVKIGDNIVYDERLWSYHHYLINSPMAFARGLTALQDTEPSQSANMTGQSAAFVWFEKLWSTPPSISFTGVETGWRMHVSNSTGLDLWTLDSTGYHAIRNVENSNFYGPERRKPRVVASSDRYFYVNDFFVPCRGGVPDDFETNITYPTGYTGFVPNSGVFFYTTITGSYINGSAHVAFSHDGRRRFPLGRVYGTQNAVVDIKETGYVINLPFGASIPYISDSAANGVYDIYTTDCIKNSDNLPYCPSYNMYDNPTGSPLYISPFSEFSSGTGIGLGLYTLISGQIIIASGIYNSGYYD